MGLLGACLLLVWQLPVSAGPKVAAGPYHVELTADPVVIPVGKARLIFQITGAGNQVVEGAQVRAIAQMPGMPMGEQEAPALPVPGRPGVYAMPATFAMEGGYTAVIKITGPQGAGVAQIPLKTGQNTTAASGDGISPALVVALLGGLGLFVFVIYRMRRTGQRVNWRGVLNRRVLGGLALVALMLAGAVYAVKHFRRPGAMDPIESQGMKMSTPAPPGTVPVELAAVRRGTVESTVRYTGQAVGFLEQEVTPRIRGYITWMPFYAGDRVQRGQVLARLDTSEVAPQVAERTATVAIARQGVEVARADYRQALGAVNQAEAELGTKEGALAQARSGESRARGVLREAETDLKTARGALVEAQADLTSAQEERSGAEADLATAQSQVPEATAQLQAARADREYWTVQLGRTRVLLTEGAVSDEEYRREKAQAENADAKVRQAQARIEQVQGQLRGAQARVRKANAGIASATAKATQAQARIEGSEARIEQAKADLATAAAGVQVATADLDAHHAHVRQTESAANAARQRINQAQSGVRQAQASLGGATTAESYTAIYSQLDGVVTQRVISPGQLVNPGQAVLRVAQISPIRLQANVADADLSRIRVGSAVTIRDRVPAERGGRPAVQARVSSAAPLVDPRARTGLVETIVPNRTGRFLPGQYVVMDISTGRSASTLYVPAPAVRWRTPPSTGVTSTQAAAYVWVAEPIAGQTEQFTVRQVSVRVGLSNGSTTEVLSGLEAGQQVVTAGQDYLKDGDTVAAVNSSPGAGPAGRSNSSDAAGGASSRPEPAAQRYTCPMHPEVVSDRPGKCPKCGMELVPKKGPTPANPDTAPDSEASPPPPELAPGTPESTAPGGRISPVLPPRSAPMPSPGSAPGAGMGGMGGGTAPSSPGAMSPGMPPVGGMRRTPSMGSPTGMPRGAGPGMSRSQGMPMAAPGGNGGPGMEMPSGGGVPGMPPRGGVPRTPPSSAQPAPRGSGSSPGMKGTSGSTPGAMPGMGGR